MMRLRILKKCCSFILTFSILFCFLTGCKTETPNAPSPDESFSAGSPPDEPEPYFSPGEADRLPAFDDYENETDYSAIAAEAEFPEYSRDTETVKVTVTDQNAGKSFYVFHTPFLEVFRDGEWKRLNYRPPELSEEGSWLYCCVDPKSEKSSGIEFVFKKEFLKDDFDAGDYRLVIFVGDRKIYAPFTVVGAAQ